MMADLSGKKILDACCGGRMCWIDKMHPHAHYIDIRREAKGHVSENPKYNPNHCIEPDEIVDFRDMPYDDNTFSLVLFDPPHIFQTNGKVGTMGKRYGLLNRETWKEDLRRGFSECWRVLRPEGVLIFKWSTCNIPLKDVLALFPHKPLFGQVTGKSGSTRWMTFMKLAEQN